MTSAWLLSGPEPVRHRTVGIDKDILQATGFWEASCLRSARLYGQMDALMPATELVEL